MDTGKWGEDRAAEYLEKCGYRICVTNYRKKTGEIDIIAFDGEVLCFIEVKTRSGIEFGLPCEAVDRRKIQRLRRTALQYILESKMTDCDCRIDIVEILRAENKSYVRHLENAVVF